MGYPSKFGVAKYKKKHRTADTYEWVWSNGQY